MNVAAPVAGAAVRVHDGKPQIQTPKQVRTATPMKAIAPETTTHVEPAENPTSSAPPEVRRRMAIGLPERLRRKSGPPPAVEGGESVATSRRRHSNHRHEHHGRGGQHFHRHEGGRNERDRNERDRNEGGDDRNGRRHRRHRGRGRRGGTSQQAPPAPVVADSETVDGSIRRATAASSAAPANSYLADPGDACVPPHVVRQFGLRRGDLVDGVDRPRPARIAPCSSRSRRSTDVDPALVGAAPRLQVAHGDVSRAEA